MLAQTLCQLDFSPAYLSLPTSLPPSLPPFPSSLTQVRALGVARKGRGGIVEFLQKAVTPPTDTAMSNALELLLHIGTYPSLPPSLPPSLLPSLKVPLLPLTPPCLMHWSCCCCILVCSPPSLPPSLPPSSPCFFSLLFEVSRILFFSSYSAFPHSSLPPSLPPRRHPTRRAPHFPRQMSSHPPRRAHHRQGPHLRRPSTVRPLPPSLPPSLPSPSNSPSARP